MTKTITWLHISDLHAGSKNFNWDAKDVISGLIDDLKHLYNTENLRPDLIFFTGDIAFGQIANEKGKRLSDQYILAQEFLEEVMNAFTPRIPLNNVFLVPGNHDINRDKVTGSSKVYLNQAKITDIEKHINDMDYDWANFMARLKDYEEFLEKNNYDHLLQDRGRLTYTAIREINNIKVGIAGFNSVWSCCQDGEKGRLWLAGEWMYNNLWQKIQDVDLSIMLIHHPLDWFREEENYILLKNKVAQKFNFLLHGHEHQGWVDNNNEHVRIAAYASYENSRKEAGYNLVRINLETGEGQVWLRTYDKTGGAWVPREIGGRTHHGVWYLHLDWLKQPADPTMKPNASQIPSHLNIYISGTYRDIKHYWNILVEKLQHLATYLNITIDFYPKKQDKSGKISSIEDIEDIEDFDIYIGLIGQLYGKEIPNGTSITELEYEKALTLYEKNKPEILIYFADEENENFLLYSKCIEKDENKYTKQQKFKNKLGSQHSIKTFISPQDLATKVVNDIHRLMDEGHFVHYRVFDADNMYVVCDAIDDNKRKHKIEEFMFSIAEHFRNLFKLNPQQLHDHPFLKDLNSKLTEMIPGISTTSKDGILIRSNIRHIILRQESFLSVLRRIEESELYDLGKEIGKGAAEDVIVNVLERRKFIPASPEAFVYLWDYWDKTGGWGTLKLRNIDEIDKPVSYTKDKFVNSTWYITVENNCLGSSQIGETQKLYNLWKGYIHGFFDHSLPKLGSLIDELPESDKKQVVIPAFSSVKSVEIMKSSLDTIEFAIFLEPKAYSASRESLRAAKQYMNKQLHFMAGDYLKQTLKFAEEENPELFSKFLKSHRETRILSHILRADIPRNLLDNQINLWFESVNHFINELSQMVRYKK